MPYVLHRVGDLRSQEDDDPRELDPEQGKRDGSEAPVDSIVSGDPEYSIDVECLEDLESDPCDHTCHQRWDEVHPYVRYSVVQASEGKDDQHVGHEPEDLRREGRYDS